MEFKEFSEYPDVEEQDYDIKSSRDSFYSNNSTEDESSWSNEEIKNVWQSEIDSVNCKEADDFFEEDVELSNFIEEDIFEDDKIEETLKKYNYDYKYLLRELTSFISYGDLMEILNECGIKKEEYLNPTYETFDIIRDKIIHNKKRAK